MANNNNNNQPTAHIKSSASVEVTIQQVTQRKLTRRSPTGKSNYPTIRSGRMTIKNYVNGLKTITNRKYRRIDD